MKAILWPLIGVLVLLALGWTTLFGLARGTDSTAARSPVPTYTTTIPATPPPSIEPRQDVAPPADGPDEPSFLDRLAGRDQAQDRAGRSTRTDESDSGSFLDRLRGEDAEPAPRQDAREPARTRSTPRPADDLAGGSDTRLLIVLDASGSMARETRDGTSMTAAQSAVDDVLADIDPATQVGLRVFGSEVDSGGRPTQAACRDTRLVAPLAPLDRDGLSDAVRSFSPVGETPIGYTVEQAMRDLGTAGRRSILLVSDGEESCRPDPCEALREAEDSGVDVRIHTVGVRVGDTARSQLRCLAQYSGGSYTEARSDAELSGAMRSALDDFSQAAAGDGPGARADGAQDPARDTSAAAEPELGGDSTGLSPGAAMAAIIVLVIAASGFKGSRKK